MSWYDAPTKPPAGAKTYTGSGSLAGFLAGLSAGATAVLDFGTVKESVNVALKDGVKVWAAPGARPWLDGPLRISGGKGTQLWGLNNRWTGADAGGHMVKLDGGSIDYGHCEVAHASCYTLLRPGQTLTNSRIHHVWCHDNPGVSSHNANQDHGLYCSAENTSQNLLIDHCLVEDMPRGRNIKVGGPSSGGGAIGGITIRRSTLRRGYGPSNGQVSNGATGIVWEGLVLIDSKASTNLTSGSGAGSGSVYRGCASDKATGPNSSTLKDGGGNVRKTVAQLSDYAAMGAAGFGHLAP